MNTKKVLVLDSTETDILMNCGKLLREIVNGFAASSIDEIEPDTVSLINAVQQMAQETINVAQKEKKEVLN